MAAFEALFRAASFPLEKTIAQLLKEMWEPLSAGIEMRLLDKTAKIEKQKKKIHNLREQLCSAKGEDRPHRGDPSSQAPRRILADRAVRRQTNINRRLVMQHPSNAIETIAAAVMGFRLAHSFAVKTSSTGGSSGEKKLKPVFLSFFLS